MSALDLLPPRFAAGLERFGRAVADDGALPAGTKALFMAAAAAVRGADDVVRCELVRARHLGVAHEQGQGAAVTLLLSRGEPVFAGFCSALADAFGPPPASDDHTRITADREEALAHFREYFGAIPTYVELMGAAAPAALEGYYLMRSSALTEGLLEPKLVELLAVVINAADHRADLARIHVGGARRQGATTPELVEALLCAVPAAGMPAWIATAPLLLEDVR